MTENNTPKTEQENGELNLPPVDPKTARVAPEIGNVSLEGCDNPVRETTPRPPATTAPETTTTTYPETTTTVPTTTAPETTTPEMPYPMTTPEVPNPFPQTN